MNSIYTPRVENNQSSSSLMWVRNGPIDETNKIVIGWHVSFNLCSIIICTIVRNNCMCTTC